MGYSSESRTFIGAELPNIGRDKHFDVGIAPRNGESLEAFSCAEAYGRDSIQYRFNTLEPTEYELDADTRLPFVCTSEEADCDYRVGNPTDGFGGYAGFDLSFMTLAERARVAAALPELASAIVARLAQLGVAVDADAVELREYMVHGL